jgi:hypothetical protein
MTASARDERPLLSICLGATRGSQIRAAHLLGLNRRCARKSAISVEVIKDSALMAVIPKLLLKYTAAFLQHAVSWLHCGGLLNSQKNLARSANGH